MGIFVTKLYTRGKDKQLPRGTDRSIQGLAPGITGSAQDWGLETQMLSHWGSGDSGISHHISGPLISSPK